ncbi:Ig-like domain-containing protein [Anaerosporobacter sp.]
MKKRIISSLLTLLLLVAIIVPEQAQAAVKINKTTATLYTGEKVQLKISGSSRNATWTSSNKTVTTVDRKGNVTAKKKGTATITAKVSGKKYKCKVTVKNNVTTFKFPTESYSNDLLLPSIFEEIGTLSIDISGNYTIIKCKTKSVDKTLKALKKELAKSIENIISKGSISKIKYNDDYTKINIYQAKELSDDDNFGLLEIYLSLPYLQILSGTNYDDADVYVTVYDKNNKITYQGSLKDSMNN